MGGMRILQGIDMKFTYITYNDSKCLPYKCQRYTTKRTGFLYGRYLNPLTDIAHIRT